MSITEMRKTKEENLRLYFKSYEERAIIAQNMPLHMQIEMTNTCNLKCIMCTSAWPKGAYGERRYLERKLLQKLCPYYKYSVLVEPQGSGEPMLHKDFMTNLEEIKKNSASIIFTTNGTLLTQEKIQKLVELYVDVIIFSIDGATKETFEAIRRGTTFEKVVGNIKLLNQIKKEAGRKSPHDKPQWMVNFVVMEKNYREMPKMLEMLHEYNGTFINFIDLCVHSEEMRAWQKCYGPEDKPLIDEVNGLAKQYGIGVFHHPSLYDELSERSVGNASGSNWVCYRPWKSVYVKWDGAILPCCFWDKRIDNWGNLTDDGMEDIWNGEKAQKTRTALRAGKYPEACAHCRTHKSFWNVPDDVRQLFDRCFEQ